MTDRSFAVHVDRDGFCCHAEPGGVGTHLTHATAAMRAVPGDGALRRIPAS